MVKSAQMSAKWPIRAELIQFSRYHEATRSICTPLDEERQYESEVSS